MRFWLSLIILTACSGPNVDLSRDWQAPAAPRLCGNGVIDETEECDDGNIDDDDQCLNNCVQARCGDGKRRTDVTDSSEATFEACDDGNSNDQDNCTNDCNVPYCGDGVTWLSENPQTGQAQEACDDGNLVDDDECTTDCQTAACGDVIIRTDLEQDHPDFEECDDGNRESGDGCTENCVSERCGDSMTIAPEECDDGNNEDGDACTSQCIAASCGDGIVRNDRAPGEAGYEECDDGNRDNTDSCTNGCAIERCGDGILSSSEGCDDGNDNPEDTCTNCAPAGCGDGAVQDGESCDDGNAVDTDACTSNCLTAFCGDGLHRQDRAEGEDGYEACDDGNPSNSDACTSNCRVAVCGDHHLFQAQEACDDGNLIDGDGCERDCTLSPNYSLLAAGDGYSCALATAENGRGIYCWGKPVDRRVRLLDEDRRIEVERVIPPLLLEGSEAAVSVQGGSTFSCYRTRDENVFCWGLNSSGQLGREGDPILPQANQLTAEQVRGLDSIRLLALGDAHACALRRDGRLFCWGENKHQQARYLPRDHPERSVDLTSPVEIDVPGQPQKLAVGAEHTCVLMANGHVSCMGRNTDGQIGIGNFTNSANARIVLNLPGVVGIASSTKTNCAWNREETYCWGNHLFGQIPSEYVESPQEARRSGTPQASMQNEHLPHPITWMVGGGDAFCTPNEDRLLMCWGHNHQGQLTGRRETIVHATPVPAGNDNAVARSSVIAMGAGHTCASSPGEPIRCWGHNLNGQLGGESGPESLLLWDPNAAN